MHFFCRKICVYGKKAVPLHPLLNRRHVGAEKNRFLSAFEKETTWCGSSVG